MDFSQAPEKVKILNRLIKLRDYSLKETDETVSNLYSEKFEKLRRDNLISFGLLQEYENYKIEQIKLKKLEENKDSILFNEIKFKNKDALNEYLKTLSPGAQIKFFIKGMYLQIKNKINDKK